MTNKTMTMESDSDYEPVNFLKWGLKDKTLCMLKSIRDKIVNSLDQVSWEDLQDVESRIEEISRHYFM